MTNDGYKITLLVVFIVLVAAAINSQAPCLI